MKLNTFEYHCMNNPLRRLLMAKLEMGWFKGLLERHGVDPTGERILDIACGNGYSSTLIRKEFRPSLLVGFDLMESQLGLARKEGADHLLLGDVTRLALADESFDVGFGFGILHHITDWRAGVRELVRVIRPGGHLIMEEPDHRASEFFRKYVRFAIPKEGQFSWPEFLSYFEDQGMTLLGEKTLFLDPFKSFLWVKRG